MKRTVVDGDAVSRVAGSYKVFETEHNVLDLDGDDYRLINKDGGASIVELYDLAEKLVPSLGAGVNRLSGQQIGQIIAIADGRVQEVEAEFPNGSGPETTSNSSAAPA